MKELKDLQELVKKIHTMYTGYEDIQLLIEMGYEEDDASVIEEISDEIQSFEACYEELRIQTLLSGEYDSCNAVMTIHAGAGGTESCDWAGMLYRMYSRWAERRGFAITVLDYLDGVCTLEAAVDTIKRETRHFAKRQLTWFRREKEVTWVEKKNFADMWELFDFLIKDFETNIGKKL